MFSFVTIIIIIILNWVCGFVKEVSESGDGRIEETFHSISFRLRGAQQTEIILQNIKSDSFAFKVFFPLQCFMLHMFCIENSLLGNI